MKVALDRKIVIQKPTITQDAKFGSQVKSWATYATVWAEVVDAQPSKSEAVRSGLEQAQRFTRVRIRYRSDIDSTMRISWGGRVMQITAPPAEIGRHDLLELSCIDFTTDGAAA